MGSHFNFSLQIVNKTAKHLRVKMPRAVTLLLLVTFLLGPSHAFFWSRLFGSSSPSPPSSPESPPGSRSAELSSGSSSPSPPSSPASPPGSRSAELTPSWDSGADSLTWRQAQLWCESRGLRAVSVDTEAKAQEVLGLLSKSGMDYFWTSGIKHKGSDDSVRWANGASGRITPGSYPWSVFGFGNGKEDCIGALNVFFYPDGARLHDIGCEHTKPVLCEK